MRKSDFEKEAVAFCFDKGINITPRQAGTIAEFFYTNGYSDGYADGTSDEKIMFGVSMEMNEYITYSSQMLYWNGYRYFCLNVNNYETIYF